MDAWNQSLFNIISAGARAPDGWKVISAKVNGQSLNTDEKGTVDLTRFKSKVAVQFVVKKS